MKKRRPVFAVKGSILKNNIFQNLKKDYRVEFRNRYALNISISFAIISTLSMSLASGGTPISAKMQAIILWIILFFSAMNGLSHIFIREEEQGTALFLRLNAKPGIVLTSKLLFNISLFFILEGVIIPLFIFFLDMKIKALTPFIAIAIVGGLAMSCSATILAAIASKSGGKGPLFAIISFPIILPIIWIASNATANALINAEYSGIQNIIFLLAFSVSINALSYILFDYIWIEE